MTESDAINRLDLLISCQQAVGGLMCPDEDIVDRDKIAVLLDYLAGEQDSAMDDLREARRARQANR